MFNTFEFRGEIDAEPQLVGNYYYRDTFVHKPLSLSSSTSGEIVLHILLFVVFMMFVGGNAISI